MENGTGTITRERPAGTPVTQASCRHHWVIEAPNGPISRGVCKLCHAEKDFQNSFRDPVTTETHHPDALLHPAKHPIVLASRKPIA